jgi:hypothetical protein
MTQNSLGKLISGVFDVSNHNFTDSDLGKIPILRGLKTLILSDNDIHTFEFLKPQPNLTKIIAVGCPVKYLNGLPNQPSLTELDISNSPIAAEPQFRYVAFATVPQLTFLNNVQVSNQEQVMAGQISRTPNPRLYLGKIESKSRDNENSAMLNLYLQRHTGLFGPFARNRAVLYDLNKFGRLPQIDESSTSSDIVRATQVLRERNEQLRDEIRLKAEELGLPSPV